MLRNHKSFWISVVIKVFILILNFSKDLKEYVGFETEMRTSFKIMFCKMKI